METICRGKIAQHKIPTDSLAKPFDPYYNSFSCPWESVNANEQVTSPAQLHMDISHKPNTLQNENLVHFLQF